MSNAYAETKSERERRVRVALALSAGPQLAADGCGVCLDNEAVARGLARAQHKPLVLFVGGCGGTGEAAVDGGAVACRVSKYTGDDRPADEPRIVVLSPKDADTWTIMATLPSAAKVDEIRKAVAEAKPLKATTHDPADWFAEEVKPAVETVAKPPVASPIKRYRQVCVNGVCRLEEIVD